MNDPKDHAQATDQELTEEDLEQISGGARPTTGGNAAPQDLTPSKAKTADKAYKQMDAYIKQ